MSIGQWLQSLRDKRKLRLKEAAFAIGVSTTLLWQCENNCNYIRGASFFTVKRICAFYKVSLDEYAKRYDADKEI